MSVRGLDDAAITSWIADWVLDFAAPCYGPRGQSKLIDMGGGEGRILKSGASALREAGILHPDLQAYVDLASAVQQHAGDQATGSLLLAARLVRNAMASRESGVANAVHVEGYGLALRQARGYLAATARKDDGTALDRIVSTPGLAPLVLEGLRGLAKETLDLDAIDVRAEETGPEWLPGVVVDAKFEPRQAREGAVTILLLSDRWRAGPYRQEFSYRMGGDVPLAAWSGMEDERRRDAVAAIRDLGVGLVVCSQDIDPEVAGDLARAGILVATDAPLSALARLERATGASRVPRIHAVRKEDLGAADVRRRRGRRKQWLVSGKGPSSTLVVPAATDAAKAAASDDAERLLRAAGSFLDEPLAVPGGGRWQRGLAKSLRGAADAAPGTTPVAMRDAAKALDALADDLVRNHGLDPLDHPLAPDADVVFDVARSVRIAVVAAFEMAIQVLRIDDRLAKRPSEGGWLRGADKASLVEAGDVPPLM